MNTRHITIGFGVVIILIALVFGFGRILPLLRRIGNDPPVIDDFIIPDSIEAGSDLEFRVIAHDADDDGLTYSWTVTSSEVSDEAGLYQSTTYTGTVSKLALRHPEDAQKLQMIWNDPNGWVDVRVHVHDGVNAPATQRKVLKFAKSTEKQILRRQARCLCGAVDFPDYSSGSEICF